MRQTLENNSLYSHRDSSTITVAMEFTEKSVEELGEWMRVMKFSENTVQIFKVGSKSGQDM